MTADDPNIRLPLLAVAMGKSEQSVKLDILRGKVPLPRNLRDTVGRTRVWTPNEIRAWRPDIAVRCEILLKALESSPPAAA